MHTGRKTLIFGDLRFGLMELKLNCVVFKPDSVAPILSGGKKEEWKTTGKLL